MSRNGAVTVYLQKSELVGDEGFGQLTAPVLHLHRRFTCPPACYQHVIDAATPFAGMTSNLSFHHFLCFLFKNKRWYGYLRNLGLLIKFLHFNRQKMAVGLTELNRMQLNENKSKIFENDLVFSVFNSLQDGVLRFSPKTSERVCRATAIYGKWRFFDSKFKSPPLVAMATELLEILTKKFLKSWVYVYQVWMISVHYEASYSQNMFGRINETPCKMRKIRKMAPRWSMKMTFGSYLSWGRVSMCVKY